MNPMHILVIGGVAAGASFAARARRLDETAKITLVERGNDVSFANCGLPYHIGGEIPVRDVLAVQTPASLKDLLNVDARTRCEALKIDRDNKRVLVRNLQTLHDEWLSYDKLMLAPGASPRMPSLPGSDDSRIHTLRNLADMDRIIAATGSGMNAVVAGAGFIGLEMAEQLQRKGLNVKIVQKGPYVLPQLDAKMAVPLEKTLALHGIGVYKNDEIVRFESGKTGLACHLASGRKLEADIVVMSIGIEPETGLARDAGLSLGKRGHILVNEFMQTSDPDIYAAGDAVETADRVFGEPVSVALGGPANRQGRVAADHLLLGEKARPYPGSLGTAIVRVFDLAAGVTGWTEKRLKAAGRPYGITTVNDFHHASYFPGAQLLTLAILWDPDSGALLGAEAVGTEGVDKRLDVLATAISAKMTVEDICHLELAYAPPFGSAKDIVNIAGFAACNERDSLVRTVSALPDDSGVQIIDVRGKAMADADPVPGARNIPLPALRNNLDKIDRNRPVVTVCALGKNSYFASRVLKQNGFDVSSLGGGLKTQIGKTGQ
ncbi:FAD-dependent oxidoreductase [Oxalobacter paraformigenes]|uniref:Rhodanese domain-containing protein n=1 Tax=Oxalobacter paraformigenes TaxID=556268 RepID=C3X2I5_9BURK|nr:FAD-dependent oxidoreductase [Oxalobacter paraformigenes]EEO27421.1 hypothetical protein OFAG_00574 [Oxalobacter paraformigenes]